MPLLIILHNRHRRVYDPNLVMNDPGVQIDDDYLEVFVDDSDLGVVVEDYEFEVTL